MSRIIRPKLRYFTIGLGLLLAAAPLWGALEALGSEANPASGPPTLTYRIVSENVSPLCTVCAGSPSGAAPILAFDPASGNTVLIDQADNGANFGSVYAGVMQREVAAFTAPCWPTFLMPGPSDFLIARCYGSGTNFSLLYINTSDGSIAGNIPIPGYVGFEWFWAWNAESSELYLVMERDCGYSFCSEHFLLTFDTESRTIGGSILLPSNINPGGVAYDPLTGHVLVSDLNGSGIWAVDSTSGQVTGPAVATGPASSVWVDGPDSLLYVGPSQPYNGSWGVNVFSLSNDRRVALLPGVSFLSGSHDASSGVTYLWGGGPIVVCQSASGREMGALNPRVSPILPSPIPGTGEFEFGVDSAPGTRWVDVVTILPVPTPQAPYSAIPVVGTDLPLAVSVVAAGIGISLLWWRGGKELFEWRRARAAELDRWLEELRRPGNP